MSHVETAGVFARRLCEIEGRRSGLSLQDAMRPVARRLKAAPGTIWGLLYEPPKTVCADLFAGLQRAIEAELLNEMRALENELAMVRGSRLGPDPSEIQEIEATLARMKELLGPQRRLAL
jgi:hypothetical protein